MHFKPKVLLQLLSSELTSMNKTHYLPFHPEIMVHIFVSAQKSIRFSLARHHFSSSNANCKPQPRSFKTLPKLSENSSLNPKSFHSWPLFSNWGSIILRPGLLCLADFQLFQNVCPSGSNFVNICLTGKFYVPLWFSKGRAYLHIVYVQISA